MTVKRVIGACRSAVLAGKPDFSGVDAHVQPSVRIELALRTGSEVVIAVNGLLSLHLTVEDLTDSLVMRLGRQDGSSGLGSSADRGTTRPHLNSRLDVWG